MLVQRQINYKNIVWAILAVIIAHTNIYNVLLLTCQRTSAGIQPLKVNPYAIKSRYAAEKDALFHPV